MSPIIFGRFGFLRPYGLFLDPHLTGLIFVFLIYVLGDKLLVLYYRSYF